MRHVLIFLLLFAGRQTTAADFGGYATLTTDYVKRGVTQSDSHAAIQIGAEVDFENGLYLGAWGSTVDIGNGQSRQRDVEVDYYAGYVFDVENDWQITVGAVAYTYPQQTGNVDYNYEEYSLGGSYEDRIWLELAYSPDLYNSGQSTINVDLFAEWPINNIWAVGLGAGHYDTSSLTGSAYEYWQLGFTASLSWADIDFRFHDTDKWVPIVSTPNRAKSRFVLAIQIPF